MGVREKLNENRRVSTAVAVVALVAAATLAWRSAGDGAPATATRAYFSDDDGKTFFVDDIDKVPPFDRNGKQALYAGVYQCGADGKPFVVYLRRWNDKGRAAVASLLADAGDPKADSEIAAIREQSVEVKRPGDANWVPEGSGAGAAVMTPACPGGGSDIRVVFP